MIHVFLLMAGTLIVGPWQWPTHRVDGTPLDAGELRTMRVQVGICQSRSPPVMGEVKQQKFVAYPQTQVKFTGLASGKWRCERIYARTVDTESPPSNVKDEKVSP